MPNLSWHRSSHTRRSTFPPPAALTHVLRPGKGGPPDAVVETVAERLLPALVRPL